MCVRSLWQVQAVVSVGSVNRRMHTPQPSWWQAAPASPNTHLDERVQLLITTDGKLQMAGRDALHLEILGRVASQLQHLSGQVLCGGKGGGQRDTPCNTDQRWSLRTEGCRRGHSTSLGCSPAAALQASECPSPRMAAVYTAAVAPTRPLAVTRVCGGCLRQWWVLGAQAGAGAAGQRAPARTAGVLLSRPRARLAEAGEPAGGSMGGPSHAIQDSFHVPKQVGPSGPGG